MDDHNILPNNELDEELSPEEIKQIKKKSIKGVFSFFLRTLILQGIGLVSAFVLSAFLSPEDFGVFGIVTQIIALLVFFSDIGLAASLIQKKNEPTEDDYKTAFTVQMLLAWAIFFIVLIIIKLGFLNVKIGNRGFKEIPFSISNRAENSHKILIGKQFIENQLDALIDVSLNNIANKNIEVEL